MSEFRGRSLRGSRGRGGPHRGSMRGRGGFSDRDSGRGFSRGRGGFSRGRGGPHRHLSRDEESPPPRKIPTMSREYDSEPRGRGPLSRRVDSYDRGPPHRSRDPYHSPPRDSGRLSDRLTPPPRSSFRDRDYDLGGSREYTSSRGDYLSPRSYSPPPRDSGSRNSFREERRDNFSKSGPRDYGSSRFSSDYGMERSRDFRDSPRDYASSRDYPPARSSDFREPLSSRGEFRDRISSRDYENGRDHHPHSRNLDRPERDAGSSRFSSRMDDRQARGPPPKEYAGRGGPRGSMRGRDDRGGRFMNGGRGRGPPRGRGRPDLGSSRGERRSPPPSRDGPARKAARLDSGDSYSSRR